MEREVRIIMTRRRDRIISLLPICIFVLIRPSGADEVYSKTEAANRLYKQGKYEEALKLYEDALLLSPGDPKLKMNKGSALYQLGDYDNAEKSYEGALGAKEKKELSTAHYNMGNIFFRKGEQMERTGDMKAQEQYKKALDHFTQSLALHPSDFDAKWNLQLAYQRIKRLEQQQQQQQNQQDNKQRQQNQNNQNDQNKNEPQNQNQSQQQDNQQQQQQQNNEQKERQERQHQEQLQEQQDKMKKEEAARLIELYADDADSLNKPPKKGIGKDKKPLKDW